MASDDIVQKIVVTADTADATAGMEDLGKRIGDALQNAAGHIDDLKASFAGFSQMAAAGALLVGGALLKMALSAADAAEAISHMQAVAGGSAENLSGMSLTLQSFGASAKDVETAVTSLSARIAAEMPKIAAEAMTNADKAARAQEMLARTTVQSSNLAIQQRELNAQRNLFFNGIELEDYQQYQLQVDKFRARQVQLDEQAANLRRERAKAEHQLQIEAANDVDQLSKKFSQLGPISFNALTTMDTKTKAVLTTLAQFKDPEQRLIAFLGLFDRMTDRETAFAIASQIGFGQVVAGVRAGESALQRYEARRQELSNAHLTLTAQDVKALTDLKDAWDLLITVLGAVKDKLGAAFAPDITTTISNTTHELELLSKGVAWLDEKLNGLLTTFSDAPDPMGKFVSYLSGPFRQAIVDAASWLVDLWTKMQAVWQGQTAGSSGAAPDAGGMPMASGGLVRGRGGIDANLAWLTAGEYVIRAASVQRIGLHALDMMNAGLAPRFASGGLNVGRLSTATATPRVLNLSIEGRSFSGLSIPESTAQSLERFAVHSQIASTGRKPSWRR